MTVPAARNVSITDKIISSGDIALRFFDHDGQECNTTLKERMISISMEQFKKIDRKISLVSGVSKANAVLSALKGGLVDVLILDSNLADIFSYRTMQVSCHTLHLPWL